VFYIKEINKTQIEVKKSIFISICFPVKDKESAKLYIDQTKEEYRDARHVTYAYKIGSLSSYSDDNEPKGCAGIEIYNNIVLKDLDNCLVIVVRYFGGVLLGAKLLTRTYRQAANNVLNNIVLLNKKEGFNIVFSFNYELENQIKYLLEGSEILNKNYFEFVEYEVNVDETTYEKLIKENIKIKTTKNISIYF
jgi:uncharacterized YigZ family protein